MSAGRGLLGRLPDESHPGRPDEAREDDRMEAAARALAEATDRSANARRPLVITEDQLFAKIGRLTMQVEALEAQRG